MLDSVISSIEKTFVNFTFRRFLFLLTILSVGVIGIYIFESYTKYGFYYRMEKKAALLQQLYDLKMQGVNNDPQLSTLYDKILSELESSKANPELLYEPYEFITGKSGIKIVSALLLPFIMIFAGMGSIKKEDTKSFISGLVIYSIICLAFGLILPTFDQIWINGSINFGFALILLIVLIKYFGSKR